MGLYYSLTHFARLSHSALSTRNQAWHRGNTWYRSGADFTATLTENTWNSHGIGTAGNGAKHSSLTHHTCWLHLKQEFLVIWTWPLNFPFSNKKKVLRKVIHIYIIAYIYTHTSIHTHTHTHIECVWLFKIKMLCFLLKSRKNSFKKYSWYSQGKQTPHSKKYTQTSPSLTCIAEIRA